MFLARAELWFIGWYRDENWVSTKSAKCVYVYRKKYIPQSDCISIDKNGFSKCCIGVSLSAIIYSKRLYSSSLYNIENALRSFFFYCKLYLLLLLLPSINKRYKCSWSACTLCNVHRYPPNQFSLALCVLSQCVRRVDVTFRRVKISTY